MFKRYYQLTKPGIIYGNLLNAAAGFMLASPNHIAVSKLIAVLAGTTLVIASACVFNNYIDRDIDRRMARTRNRALVTNKISTRSALIFATMLGLIGMFILIMHTNSLVVWVGVVGFIDYVVVYGYVKRRSVYGTLVGTVSGSAPILAGYLAARGHYDTGAVWAFVIIALWQMAHFYAIAMYRHKDYQAANIPVYPVVRGMHRTKVQVLCFILAFVFANAALTLRSYTGFVYLMVMTILGGYWFRKGLLLWDEDDEKWGKSMFLFSLTVILITTIMMVVGPRLP